MQNDDNTVNNTAQTDDLANSTASADPTIATAPTGDASDASDASAETQTKADVSLPPEMMDVLGEIADVVARAMNFVEAAERVLKRLQSAHPDHTEALDKTFMTLVPVDGMEGMPLPLYERHCEELLQRVIDRADLREITKAEALFILSMGSLRAPLNTTAFLLYARLFGELYPEDHAMVIGQLQDLPREPHTGAVDQLYDVIRSHFRRHTKRLNLGVETGDSKRQRKPRQRRK